MIIVLKPDVTKQQIAHVEAKIRELGLKPMLSAGKERTIIGVIGEEDKARLQPFEAFPGVESVVQIQKPYKFVSKEFKKEASVIKIAPGVEVGGEKFIVMAGPCTVENKERLLNIAKLVKKSGAKVLRGGAFMPRLAMASNRTLRVETPEQSMAMLKGVLNKEPGAARDIVILNAGAALYAANVADSMKAGIILARQAIDSGAAKGKLEQLVSITTSLAA